MNQHPAESELNDYVDGLLDARTRASVAAHLAVCAECGAEVEALRSLVARIGALPLQIAPERDLRADIAASLARAPATTAPQSPRRLRWFVPLTAAAMLVVATATVTRWVGMRESPRESEVRSAPGPVIPVAFLNEESRYHNAIAELQQTLDRERARLAPQTIAILERNLAIIDRAIAESRAALSQDPAHPHLGSMILSAYEQKLQLLQRARASAL